MEHKNVMCIRQRREAAGMSVNEFAASVGTYDVEVELWESEVYLPKTRQLPLMAKVLCCTIDDLFV